MILHWIFGGSGSGRSTYAYNEITRLSKDNPDKRYIVIVPEQFTMQTQKDMVMMSGNGGIMNIDVLSFMRLAYRVLEDTPALSKPVLADEGKGMIIRRILREHETEWQSFGKNIRKPGFVEEIKSIITEFIQYRINEEKIDGMIGSAEGNLVRKLSDLKKVYKYYIEFLEERYISSEEILKILADHVQESGMLKNCVICFDGFTGFTPVQYLLLRELMSVCSDMYITACIEKNTDYLSEPKLGELFYMSKEFIGKCNKAAMERHCEIADPIWTGSENGLPWRFINNPEMSFIEKYIFRNTSDGTLAGSNTKINIYDSSGTGEEAEHCIWEIRRLVRKEGLRYRDIAIVTGDMDEYSRILKKKFDRLDMPYFIDYNRSVVENPFVRMILLVLENAIYGYDRNRTIRLLRNAIVRDYMNFPQNEVDEIDNYVLARGIRGKTSWNRPFDAISEEAQSLRERFVEVFISAGTQIRDGKTADERSKALYKFLTDNKMSDVLYSIADDFANTDPVLKKEYEQIYRIVIGMLDQISELMGDEVLSLREYYDILKTGLEEASVGVVPPGIDTIIVGDTTRTRLKDVKVLFFLGVNDGLVPAAVQKGGFLSDSDRIRLIEGGATLAPTAREKIFNDRFYIYLNLTKPSDMLFLSYSRKNSHGDSLEPSVVFDELKSLYSDGLTIETDFRMNGIEAELANDLGMDRWISGLRRYIGSENKLDITPEWSELHKRYAAEYPEMYEYAFFAGNESHISKEAAAAVYGNVITGSVSRLETYAACPYAHFLEYALKLKERKEFSLEPADVGTLFHMTIELFTKKMKDSGMRWQDADDNTISRMVSAITDELCGSYGNGIMQSEARNRYMVSRIKRIAERSISILVYHMKKGKFEVEDCEVQFSYRGKDTIRLDNGKSFNLTGRIDRLDVCRDGDRILYKIIDYKSGEKDFSISDLYNGINMQLAVYLMAADDRERTKNKDKKTIPAGVFYFHIDDPYVEGEERSEERLKKEFRMKGVVNTDEGIPCLIDNGLGTVSEGYIPKADSDVINVKVNASGDLSKRSKNNYTSSQIRLMKLHVTDKMKEYACGILDGNTSISPLKVDKNTDACTYCRYKAVCRFDARLAANRYRKTEKKDDNIILDEWWNKYYGVYEESKESD